MRVFKTNNGVLFFLFMLIGAVSLSAQELVYYCSDQSGTFQVYQKELSSGKIDTLTNNINYNYWWVEPSPSHQHLLLMRSPVGNGIPNQFAYDSAQIIRTDKYGLNDTVLVNYHQHQWTAFGNPHWHPNGKRIILLAEENNSFNIFSMDKNGANPKQLTTQFSIDPNWNSKGDQLVFVGLNANPTIPPDFDDFEIFTADYDYQGDSMYNIVQLTNDTLRDQDPCFSPNDSLIVFSSGPKTLLTANIVRMDVNGGNRTDLVNDSTTNGGPINWGANNKIYYHNVNLFISPFAIKTYDVSNQSTSKILPLISANTICPYYVNLSTLDVLKSKIKVNQIMLFPNPIGQSARLSVDIDQEFKNAELKIVDSKGVVVLQKQNLMSQNTIDLNRLNNGFYFVCLTIDGNRVNQKLIKQ